VDGGIEKMNATNEDGQDGQDGQDDQDYRDYQIRNWVAEKKELIRKEESYNRQKRTSFFARNMTGLLASVFILGILSDLENKQGLLLFYALAVLLFGMVCFVSHKRLKIILSLLNSAKLRINELQQEISGCSEKNEGQTSWIDV
tara:strand:+ start:3104 stop:3535 length:432 start_codon:yes stop_codon:yes gene_type:complete